MRKLPNASMPGRGTRALAILLASAALGGCLHDQSTADLESYAQQVLAKKGPPIDPLPPVEIPEVYTYQCIERGCVDPFEPFFREDPAPPTQEQQVVASGIQPNFDRNREEFESYTLDSLRMLGTLEQEQQIWGIIRSPDSVIHRVQVGNYMGKNHGKILSVMEERIDLAEIVPDGQGGWKERDASIALVE